MVVYYVVHILKKQSIYKILPTTAKILRKAFSTVIALGLMTDDSFMATDKH